MVMPRPSGKALKIAQKTIPGMPKYIKGGQSQSSGYLKNDYETTMIEINENRGKLSYKTSHKGESGIRRWDFRSAGYA